jgi:xylulose-5-phosphate/fructose-6-phosphate phosphoketolase
MSALEAMKQYVRAANYLSAAQIYLQDNVLLREPLAAAHIKPRLLGHWGTCPGINFVRAQLNAWVKKHDLDLLMVVGPGHGFPAIQAELFIEGTLGKYYPEVTSDQRGIERLCRQFSWPYGFPSHSNPGTPGVILEGGELGYSLATAYGATLDNPNLVAVCVVGDGEAETGPLATAWHLNKIVDPATNGAVLPILHLNGYKISGPTIFGRMSDQELEQLFRGYGYEPHFVTGSDDEIYPEMWAALERCHQIIAKRDKVRPMIVLRTPKGWTGIKELDGKKIEGNHLSHQVVAAEAKSNDQQRRLVEEWLRSYRFGELFDEHNGWCAEIRGLIPAEGRKIGENAHTFGGSPVYQPLKLPPVEQFSEDATVPGTIGSSSMRRAGEYLREVFRLNEEQRNFRLFSPDETYSNKLDAVFAATARGWVWPTESWDKDLATNGRVLEMLSEHNLQGLTQGYVLTGRHAIFASYEAFVQIVTSMADQYAKFLKAAREVSWRHDVPSLNYILTSSGWRQEHNGFSHQNPGFVSDMMQRPGCFVNVYFPPDGNSMLAVLERCLQSKNEINVIAAGKTLEPRWLTPELAREELKRGLMTWDFASDANPDVVLAAAGDYLTKEALAAIALVKQEDPTIRLRFVNVLALSALGLGDTSCRVPFDDFADYFTADKPVIFNFHGYPNLIKEVLYDIPGTQGRFTVHGYQENGSTTTPFDMMVRNGTSRYDLAIEVFERTRRPDLAEKYREKIRAHGEYIREHGVDPADIEQWQWPSNIS